MKIKGKNGVAVRAQPCVSRPNKFDLRVIVDDKVASETVCLTRAQVRKLALSMLKWADKSDTSKVDWARIKERKVTK